MSRACRSSVNGLLSPFRQRGFGPLILPRSLARPSRASRALRDSFGRVFRALLSSLLMCFSLRVRARLAPLSARAPPPWTLALLAAAVRSCGPCPASLGARALRLCGVIVRAVPRLFGRSRPSPLRHVHAGRAPPLRALAPFAAAARSCGPCPASLGARALRFCGAFVRAVPRILGHPRPSPLRHVRAGRAPLPGRSRPSPLRRVRAGRAPPPPALAPFASAARSCGPCPAYLRTYLLTLLLYYFITLSLYYSHFERGWYLITLLLRCGTFVRAVPRLLAYVPSYLITLLLYYLITLLQSI